MRRTHTPGPWSVDPFKPAIVRAYNESTDSYAEVADCGLNQHPEARCNAALIAAAPGMLAIIRDLADCPRDGSIDETTARQLVEWARDILAKATKE